MLVSVLAILAGFALLVWGADRFVLGAAGAAANLGVSPLIIGLTIVGFGTSAPEMLVSGMAALNGNPHLGMGNALGSNIANVGLVLGTAALVSPMLVRSETLRREFPVLLATMAGVVLLLIDGTLSRNDGVILLVGMAAMIFGVVQIGLREREVGSDPLESTFAEELPDHMSNGTAALWLVTGMTVLLGSSRLLVWGAVNVAQHFGVPDLVIGLTVVAIGTSLPELAATVASALKGEDDIALGNVLGSNMFNLLAVMGLPAVIAPDDVPPEVLGRDYPLMFGLTVALFAMAFGFRGSGRINRIEGVALLIAYVGYLLTLAGVIKL